MQSSSRTEAQRCRNQTSHIVRVMETSVVFTSQPSHIELRTFRNVNSIQPAQVQLTRI